jgi:hypothetical protein
MRVGLPAKPSAYDDRKAVGPALPPLFLHPIVTHSRFCLRGAHGNFRASVERADWEVREFGPVP